MDVNERRQWESRHTFTIYFYGKPTHYASLSYADVVYKACELQQYRNPELPHYYVMLDTCNCCDKQTLALHMPAVNNVRELAVLLFDRFDYSLGLKQ